MILTCPQCATRYQADAAKFQPSGRNVRCAKCGHLWHQDAPAAEPDPVSEVPIIDEAPPAAPVPEPPPRAAALAPAPAMARERVTVVQPPRERAAWPMQLATAAGWAGLVAIVLVIGWSALTFRQQVATLWPQSASLYAALGVKTNASGIDISDVRYRRAMENGESVLALTGELKNGTARELPVPQIRVALIDDDRHELYHWTFVPGVMTLHPGQSTTFHTRLSNPPAGARRFELRFAKAGE